jgi:hypothetical protein
MSPPNNKIRQASEAEIDEAVAAVKERIVKTAYEAQKQYGVSRATNLRLLRGKTKPEQQAHENDQLLCKKEEEVLVLWCKELTEAGHPLPPAMLQEMAREIQESCVASVFARTGVPIRSPPHWHSWDTTLSKLLSRA